MARLLSFMVYLWHKKIYFIVPALFLPFIGFLWNLSVLPSYKASTTLSVDQKYISSPLLKNISSPENAAALERRIKNKSLIEDVLYDSGQILFDKIKPSPEEISLRSGDFLKALDFEILESGHIYIAYTHLNKDMAKHTLEIITTHFIDDILAPERLRIEEKLMNLAEQVQYYSTEEKKLALLLAKEQKKLAQASSKKQEEARLKTVVQTEFKVQKALAQKKLAQQDYEKRLVEARSLISGSKIGKNNLIIQFIEPPTLVSGKRELNDHAFVLWLAFKIGLLIGALGVLMSRLFENTLINDREIEDILGLPITGRIPHLGEISLSKGRVTVDPRHKYL